MSGVTLDPRLQPRRGAPKKPLTFSWSDPRVRNVVWQVLIIGALVALVAYLVYNTNKNIAARRITTGFGFLSRTAPIPIGESLIEYIPSVSTYGRAMVIGVLNTLKVAVIGCVLATLWGTLIGVGRLSKNFLIARLAAIYVEVVRDIPLLLQLIFWYGVTHSLPEVRQALNPIPGVFLSNRGTQVPSVPWSLAYTAGLLALIVAVVLTWLYNKRAERIQNETGTRPRVWLLAVPLLIGLPLVAWALFGAPFVPDIPQKGRFNITGGALISPEFMALLVGLVIYTASYIAEIVRSGIQAVASGQWEAGGALGLRHGTVLRRIVLPQALRVIVPPMTSQYLNLIKNSSLAVAIGYQDIVSIANTTLNQTGQAIEGVFIIMVVYLTVSLSISAFMNWYNTQIRLVER